MHPFVQRLTLRFSLNAAIQRGANAPVYLPEAPQEQKIAFRESAKTWLVKLEKRYFAWEYTGDKYINEILAIRDHLSGEHHQILTNGIITLGRSQKIVSLYLKYLWLMGDVSKKPVFPVLDRGIIAAAGVPNPPNWTHLNDQNELQRVYTHIENFALQHGFGSGTVWEAETWNDEDEE